MLFCSYTIIKIFKCAIITKKNKNPANICGVIWGNNNGSILLLHGKA